MFEIYISREIIVINGRMYGFPHRVMECGGSSCELLDLCRMTSNAICSKIRLRCKILSSDRLRIHRLSGPRSERSMELDEVSGAIDSRMTRMTSLYSAAYFNYGRTDWENRY